MCVCVMKTGTVNGKFYETETGNDGKRVREKKRILQEQECRGVAVEYTSERIRGGLT